MRRRPTPLVLVVVVLVAVLAPASAASARLSGPAPTKSTWPADAVPGSLLVTAVDEETAAALDGPSYGRVAHVQVTPGDESTAASWLRQVPGIVDVEPDRWLDRLREPGDARYPEQWAHGLADAPQAWDRTTGDRTVRVAVIDSGIDGRHRDLRPNLVEQHQVTQDGARRMTLGTMNDPCDEGHGTQVAGVLGAVGDNGLDVAGVAWNVAIVDVAAVDTSRCLVSESIVIAALDLAVERDARVVNLSVGKLADTCPTAWQTAIDAARTVGVTVVAAAGNDEGDFPGATAVPASCNGVVSVGAVDELGRHASYSSANAHVDLVAPGGDPLRGAGVLTTDVGDDVVAVYGTSFAAPYVAGVAALLLAVDPQLGPEEVEDHLERATGAGRRTAALGWGVVDAGAAVAAVAAGTVAAHRPDPVFPVGLVIRVAEGDPPTDPIRQAVAVSRRVFDPDRALHVVIGRADDFADALAGSSLAYGTGPVLFTNRTGPLAGVTQREIDRVLPPGGLVYLLGGSAALPSTLEAELTTRGYDVRRLFGDTREGTAAAVAKEIPRRISQELGFPRPDRILLATARSWPDAVAASSLGAYFGYAVLLTPPGTLHPAARWALAEHRPAFLYTVGGSAAVSDAVADEARAAAGSPPATRLWGQDRFGTAAAVARETAAHVRERLGIEPQVAVAVNLQRPDGFAHVLSASAILGFGTGIYVGVAGDGGDVLPAESRQAACSAAVVLGVVAGGSDVVSDAVQDEFNALLESGC